ncbi:MAG: hypothetical protein AAF337_03575 [Pseudomonadota bacterium]
MDVVHATWERRNLGLEVYEASITPSDTQETVRAGIAALPEADYVSIKVPVAQFALSGVIEQNGFRFREQLTSVEVTQVPTLNGLQARYQKAIASRPATDQDMKTVLEEVRSGLFQTDRFSLDARFSPEQAANRYCGWIQDELARGGELHAILFKDKLAGFFLVRKTDTDRWSSLLAGVFTDFQQMGLGYFINYLAYAYCFGQGAQSVASTYSSNNLAACKIHGDLRTRLLYQSYIYARHTIAKE